MQLDLFRPPRRPATKNPRTLHVIDASEKVVQFRCICCGHETGWLKARSVGQEQAGRVCPVCKGVPLAGAAS